jgi:hypothetical protein
MHVAEGEFTLSLRLAECRIENPPVEKRHHTDNQPARCRANGGVSDPFVE